LFQGDIVKELGKARLEIDNVKRQMLQQEIAFNIQQTDALTRLVFTIIKGWALQLVVATVLVISSSKGSGSGDW
jgi:hypothetical protein